MKKFLIILITFTGITLPQIAGCQDIKLSFLSRYQNSYLKPDSIFIENLTHPGDTLLYYPDTILLLRNSLGISPYDKPEQQEFVLYPPHPNPSGGSSSIMLQWNLSSPCHIIVTDIYGKTIFTDSKSLLPGKYQLLLESGTAEVLIITFRSIGKTESVKLLNSPAVKSQPLRITFHEFNGPPHASPSSVQSTCFSYYPSDSLRFTAFAQPDSITASDVLSFVPAEDQTVIFNVLQGTPCQEMPSFFYQGQTYRTVKIGTQCWMKENLNNGIRIDYPAIPGDNGSVEKYCYQNLSENCSIYGGLYSWNEMVQWSMPPATDTTGICPPGWRLPSDEDWTILENSVGGVATAARHLKTTGTTWWLSPNDASNASGFSAMPGGYCDFSGFNSKNYSAQFWSATYNWDPHNPGGKLWYLFAYYPNLQTATAETTSGRSVRCVISEKGKVNSEK